MLRHVVLLNCLSGATACTLVDNPLGHGTEGDSGATSDADSSGTSPSSTSSVSATTGEDGTTDEGTADSTGQPSSCGNGVVEDDEVCDGDDLAGASCRGEGLGAGAIACDARCRLDTSACQPGAPTLTLTPSAIKRFDFTWGAAAGADHYALEQSLGPGAPFEPVGGDIIGESVSLTVPLHFRYDAQYRLRACNPVGCTTSDPVSVVGTLAEAVGQFVPSAPDPYDYFGARVTLSGDGSTLVVSAYLDDHADDWMDSADYGAVYVFVDDGTGSWSLQQILTASVPGVDAAFGWSIALSGSGDVLAVGAVHETLGSSNSGAVYVFTRSAMGQWTEQAHFHDDDTGADDQFGWSVALSDDGNTLAVGAPFEDSGLANNPNNGGAPGAGAAYVFERMMGAWSQQAYVKAFGMIDGGDQFGVSVTLSDDGDTLAVGAPLEDGGTSGVLNGGQGAGDNGIVDSGSVYVFTRSGDVWSPQAYVKASSPGVNDQFGLAVALSGAGDTLAVSAPLEDSGAQGITAGAGGATDDDAVDSGAVHVFDRGAMGQWSQQAYVKASNASAADHFGSDVDLSDDGQILAVGASGEDSAAIGIGGADGTGATDAGAVYVFRRDPAVWTERAYVKASDTTSGDALGERVCLSNDGDVLATGAYQHDGVGGTDVGAAYLY